MTAKDTPEVASARRAYTDAAAMFERRISEHAIAKQELDDAQYRMRQTDQLWDDACEATNRAFATLRKAVEAAS